MRFQSLQLHTRSLLLLGVIFLYGCNGTPSDDSSKAMPKDAAPAHDPDDVPIAEADVKMPSNYAEAIPRIKAYRETIRSAVEAGMPSKAHRPLDELDIVLNKLPTIARDSRVSIDHWETINTAARELRNLFDTIHAAIDEGRAPDYSAVANEIEEAIKRLESVLAEGKP